METKPALSFLPLTPDLVGPLSKMAPPEHMAQLIAPTGAWMAQAAKTAGAVTFGVFQDKTPVGLVSLLDPRLDPNDPDKPIPDCLFVWRLLVDGPAQGQGIGRAIMDFVMSYATAVGLAGVALTTMDTHAHNALPFYEKLGFTPTGRRLHDEIELVRTFPTAPSPLAFLPLTFDTIQRLSGLTTAPHKSHLVLPALRIMAQGSVSGENITFGVFKGDTPVGLISLDDSRVMNEPENDPASTCIDVWQLMVDGAHEGQGIGTALIDFAKSYAQLVGLNGVSLVTMDHADHNAQPFYEKLGFTSTGRKFGGDLELIWRT